MARPQRVDQAISVHLDQGGTSIQDVHFDAHGVLAIDQGQRRGAGRDEPRPAESPTNGCVTVRAVLRLTRLLAEDSKKPCSLIGEHD